MGGTNLQVGGQGHVDLLSVRGDPVEEQRVVQRAVPYRLKPVERPAASRAVRTRAPTSRGELQTWSRTITVEQNYKHGALKK